MTEGGQRVVKNTLRTFLLSSIFPFPDTFTFFVFCGSKCKTVHFPLKQCEKETFVAHPWQSTSNCLQKRKKWQAVNSRN